MTRRALGRGLSALLSDTTANGDELLEVDIGLIEPNPDQPRTHFGENRLEELAQSIKANGLVQPILLRRTASGRYQLVAGERRWRAAQRAGMQRISAVIRNIPDSKLLELALVENIQRQELNPIEEALAYQRLIQQLNLTQDEVAARVGKERSSIANYLRLLKLPESIRALLEAETISMGHARALLGLASDAERARLVEEIVTRGMTVRETEQAVKRSLSGEKTRVSSTPVENDANIRAAELRMKRLLGTRIRIQLSQHGGRIEISFSSMGELDRIYSIIMRKSEAPTSPENAT
jgi:ParB family transcriptional regulator, chromosome partitioning protein